MIRFFFFLFIAILCEGSAALAVDFSFYSDQYFYGEYSDTKQTTLSPDNRTLELPTNIFEADLRPQMKLTARHWDLVVRPRLELSESDIVYQNPVENQWKGKGKLDLTTAYLHFLFGRVQMTMGLEAYQWGGAELLNPSNPFFHFDPRSKNFNYVQKGEALARLGVDWNNYFNTTVIGEPISNNDPEWIAPDGTSEGSGFVPKWALKNELRNSSGDKYAGFVVGQGEEKKFFVGEYATLGFQNGLSLYVDARHQKGQSNYVPQLNFSGDYDLNKPPEDDFWWSTAVGGIRYEGTFDYRLEYLYNEPGWSREEYLHAYSSLLTMQATLPQNADRFQRPGLELRTQQYLYASIRMPDLGAGKSTTLFLRDLFSLADQSQALEFQVERILSDSLVGYLEADGFIGGEDTEFGITMNYQIFAGIKWTL